MAVKSIKVHLTETLLQIGRTWLTLLKIMVPILLLVRLLNQMGAADLLAFLLEPVMSLVGLPGDMALVWASTMLGNIYTGMAIYVELHPGDLTLAQVSTAGILMLLAHNLPVEGAIAKKVGIPWRYTLTLRVGGAMLLGGLSYWTLQNFSSWNQPTAILWKPEPRPDDWGSWLLAQIEMLLIILLVISALIILLRLLRVVGLERLMHWLLAPLLKLIGIGKEATTITIIGTTLGLAFGGALLIDEVQSGRVARRDIVLSMSFLALCHSLIEDTLLVMLLGCSVVIVLWARLCFALLVVYCLSRWRL